MDKLALLGGRPVLDRPLPRYSSVGKEEAEAVARVIESGCLSAFYGSWGDEFLGGPQVRAFEKAWCDRFQVKHTVSVNSATSGLFAAMGAIGIGPGDEVIVSPYTMSATAMAPLVYGGIPVFADIEQDTFCLDPDAVRKAITPRTKAIVVTNLFGHPAALTELMSIATEHGIKLVEDNAQGPLAMEQGRYAGTIGHIGIFSLNYHKHIHTGEGGMCVTNDDELALRLQLIRNHGENCTEASGVGSIANLVGFNYRMTELSAAVGIEQLRKSDLHVGRRERIGQRLANGLQGLAGLVPPKTRSGCRHVYYVWAARLEEDKAGVSRGLFSKALAAEGFPHFTAYVRPLYLLPLFQKRIAMGASGFPFTLSDVNYEKGTCPVVERIWENELIGFETCMHAADDRHVDLLVEAVRKVHGQREVLARSAASQSEGKP